MLAEAVEAIALSVHITVRVKIRQREAVSAWGWFIVSILGYIETFAFGPMPVREVEWVELNPLEEKYIGRLVPPRYTDHSTEILSRLANQHISSQVVEGVIRIAF